MKSSSVEVWLWLLLVMSPHNPKTQRLLEHYGSAENVARAIRDGKCHLSEGEAHRARSTRTREVRQIMEECRASNIRIITLDDPEYPALLKNIYSPPVVLFVRGTLACLDGEVSLAAVGPRDPSQSAINAAWSLCGDLARLGTVLVSGLAVGIDTIAHTCAVKAGVPTIGVLACGQLVNYPAENEELKLQIVECGGAIISELLPHATVEGRYFQNRNRIISGLGQGTLVIEASTRSGCLLTANHALEQGRDLFCVPPYDITAEKCAGVAPYLRDGAIPVFDYLDIVQEYMYHYFNRIDRDLLTQRTKRGVSGKPHGKSRSKSEEKKENAEQQPISAKKPAESEPADTPEKIQKPIAAEVYEKLGGNEAKLLRLIEEMPRTADELIEITGIPYADAVETLTELEISGLIALLPSGKYSAA